MPYKNYNIHSKSFYIIECEIIGIINLIILSHKMRDYRRKCEDMIIINLIILYHKMRDYRNRGFLCHLGVDVLDISSCELPQFKHISQAMQAYLQN